MVEESHDHKIAAAAPKNTRGAGVGHVATNAGGLERPFGCARGVHVDLVIVVVHVEESNIEMLPRPVLSRWRRARQDGQCPVYARADIAHPNEGNIGGVVFFTDH